MKPSLKRNPNYRYDILKSSLYPDNPKLADWLTLEKLPHARRIDTPKEFLPFTIQHWNLLELNIIQPKKSPTLGFSTSIKSDT